MCICIRRRNSGIWKFAISQLHFESVYLFWNLPWILGTLGTQGYLCQKKRSRRSESRVFSPLLPLHVRVTRCESFRNQSGMVCCDTPPTTSMSMVSTFVSFSVGEYSPFVFWLLGCRLKENWRRDLIDAVTHTIFRASRLIAFLLGFLLECIESGEVSCQTTC